MKAAVSAILCWHVLRIGLCEECADDTSVASDSESKVCLLQTGRKLHGAEEVTLNTSADDMEGLEEPKKVVHVSIMNEPFFWWMLGAVVFLMAVFVVRQEVMQAAEAPKPISQPEDGPPTGTKSVDAVDYSTPNLLKLAFCFAFLNATMILWGIAQEFVMTNVYYTRRNGEDHSATMPSSLFLVLCNRIFTIAFSALLLKIRGKALWLEGSQGCFAFATSNTISSWCQYASLEFLSFSLQTAAKNSKLLPVMVLGSLRGFQYKLVDYAECMVLVICCFIFGNETEDSTGEVNTTLRGVILLVAYVFSDAATPHLQDRFFKQYPQFDALQATLAMAIWAASGMLILLTANGMLWNSLIFLQMHQDAILHVLVLSLASALSQYMISYTIKHFGPLTFTLIATIRQFLSVIISAILFGHKLTALSFEAMIIMAGTVSVRAFRPLFRTQQEELYQDPASQSRWDRLVASQTLIVCTAGIVVFYLTYGLVQEFLAYHTFSGDIFQFPVFLVCANHTAATLFSLLILKIQGMPISFQDLHLSGLPASTNLLSTVLQHTALYYVEFPVQTIMKTLKILPVMLVGSVMRTRSYSSLDYFEALLITVLVCYFVWDLAFDKKDSRFAASALGTVFMLGYVVVDCFTCNLEDYVYQATSLDPAHMLLGMESISAGIAWGIFLMPGGEAPQLWTFIQERPDVIYYVGILAACAAVGAYTCTLTVRLVGPAVFTLVMTCRQILSMALSITCFGHGIGLTDSLAAVTVAAVVLMSSWRRTKAQADVAHEDAQETLAHMRGKK
mmetsp:Transcript_78642/g.138679  ORF Transcript_78642/g.138679 Transcript_78642/m.138679 type:complete len:788 (+) Transcript_78642:94-2457(+)|eukprot:CAMPEP_0197665194 /NCGR_PEP_ID=MMETSP1338-20131121/59083_1 /TAXON_ID=43686 ORGANISM="Pelagodinium beii, Strain RCC1491" /NCGR_SAMPLE_ID=MMETSP1338 /ASSEMBLY_ACC=CAM_ASM_000754 /LENGTH=787 /DNA_ID=CAMNT_0043243963 /DNA_START=94 /DNA_END=2457 /DNA_ORIENTATION=+